MENQIDVARKPAYQQRALIQRPTNIHEAAELASQMAKSGIVPYAFRGKPADILIAIGLGDSLGLNPFQAVQGIAVINGTPALFGDLAKGLVLSHPELEDLKELPIQEVKKTQTARCEVKRKGRDPVIVEFSKEDAVTAKLWGKTGKDGQATPWVTHPWRMLQMRARLFAMRDAFADVFRGIPMVEEVQDYADVVDVKPERPAPADLVPKLKEETEKTTDAAALLGAPPAQEKKSGTLTQEQITEITTAATKNQIPMGSVLEFCEVNFEHCDLFEISQEHFDSIMDFVSGVPEISAGVDTND